MCDHYLYSYTGRALSSIKSTSCLALDCKSCSLILASLSCRSFDPRDYYRNFALQMRYIRDRLVRIADVTNTSNRQCCVTCQLYYVSACASIVRGYGIKWFLRTLYVASVWLFGWLMECSQDYEASSFIAWGSGRSDD